MVASLELSDPVTVSTVESHVGEVSPTPDEEVPKKTKKKKSKKKKRRVRFEGDETVIVIEVLSNTADPKELWHQKEDYKKYKASFEQDPHKLLNKNVVSADSIDGMRKLHARHRSLQYTATGSQRNLMKDYYKQSPEVIGLESQLANSLDRHSKLSLLHYVIMKSMALGDEAVRAQCERVTQADRAFAVQVAQTRAEMASISDMDFQFEVENREQRRAQRRRSLEMWNVQSIQEEPSGDANESDTPGSDIEAEILGLPEECDEDEEEGFHVEGIIDEPRMEKKQEKFEAVDAPDTDEKANISHDTSEDEGIEEKAGGISTPDVDGGDSEKNASMDSTIEQNADSIDSGTRNPDHTPSDSSANSHSSSNNDDDKKQSNADSGDEEGITKSEDATAFGIPEQGADEENVDIGSEDDVDEVVISDDFNDTTSRIEDRREKSEKNNDSPEDTPEDTPKSDRIGTTVDQSIEPRQIHDNAVATSTEDNSSAHTDTEPDFTDHVDLIRTPGEFHGQQLDQVIEYDVGILNPTEGDNFDDDDVSYSKSDDLLSKGGLSSTMSRQSSDDDDDPNFLFRALDQKVDAEETGNVDAKETESENKKESRKKEKSESKKDKKNRRRSLSTSRHSKSDDLRSSKDSRRRSLSTSRHSKAGDLSSSKHSTGRRKSRSRSLSTSCHSRFVSESEVDGAPRRGRRPRKSGDESKRRRRSIEIDSTGDASKTEKPLKSKSKSKEKTTEADPGIENEENPLAGDEEKKKTKKTLKARRSRSRSLDGQTSSGDESLGDDAKLSTRGRRRSTKTSSNDSSLLMEQGTNNEKLSEKPKKSSSSKKKKSAEKPKKTENKKKASAVSLEDV